LGVIVGAALGFVTGAAAYLVVNTGLEDRGSWLEEFQGLAWNLVPLGVVIGAGVGVYLARAR